LHTDPDVYVSTARKLVVKVLKGDFADNVYRFQSRLQVEDMTRRLGDHDSMLINEFLGGNNHQFIYTTVHCCDLRTALRRFRHLPPQMLLIAMKRILPLIGCTNRFLGVDLPSF
jgi:hypothetical protein